MGSALQRSLCKQRLDLVRLLELSEAHGQVEQMLGVHVGSSVHFAVAIDAVSVQELVVEHHNDLLVCFPHNSTSVAEGDELPQRGIDVQHSVPDLELVD